VRPSIVMTLAEAEFLQAEALERYTTLTPIAGTASSHYQAGVEAAFRLAASTQTASATATPAAATTAADTYITGAAVGTINLAYTGAQSDKLRSIYVQKWIALCSIDGMEAWAEYRRTNTTDAAGVVTNTGSVPYSPRSVTVSGAEPVRLYYPLRELSTNPANVPTQTATDRFTSKIFWDVN